MKLFKQSFFSSFNCNLLSYSDNKSQAHLGNRTVNLTASELSDMQDAKQANNLRDGLRIFWTAADRELGDSQRGFHGTHFSAAA